MSGLTDVEWLLEWAKQDDEIAAASPGDMREKALHEAAVLRRAADALAREPALMRVVAAARDAACEMRNSGGKRVLLDALRALDEVE